MTWDEFDKNIELPALVLTATSRVYGAPDGQPCPFKIATSVQVGPPKVPVLKCHPAL